MTRWLTLLRSYMSDTDATIERPPFYLRNKTTGECLPIMNLTLLANTVWPAINAQGRWHASDKIVCVDASVAVDPGINIVVIAHLHDWMCDMGDQQEKGRLYRRKQRISSMVAPAPKRVPITWG
jgi:hypothetical protein